MKQISQDLQALKDSYAQLEKKHAEVNKQDTSTTKTTSNTESDETVKKLRAQVEELQKTNLNYEEQIKKLKETSPQSSDEQKPADPVNTPPIPGPPGFCSSELC